jgi:peptide deformylase
MAIQPILQSGDPILRHIAQLVPQELFGTPELQKILTDMTDTLETQVDGVALAAPQIGISYRIFIVRYDRTISSEDEGEGEKENTKTIEPSIGVFINPTFLKSSRRRTEMDEGCLSVRGIYGTTYRHERATVRAQDAEGKTFERGGGGLMAQIYQHETDHLEGMLFIDHALELRAPQNTELEQETESNEQMP